jgi:hypothetical protein
MPKNDIRSALYKDNLVRTCSNQGGVQMCHPDATPSFAQGKIHPLQFKAGIFDNQQDALSRKQEIEKGTFKPFQTLLSEMVRGDTGDQGKLQGMILVLIKYFYMILIGGLIGSMMVHQILDYIATRRELRRKDRPI